MTLSVTHKKVATLADQAGCEVNKGEWNDTHTITGTQPQVYAAFTTTASTVGTEEFVEITSGTFTLTLTNPTVSANQAWRTFFKNSGAGVCTLSGTIDGGSSWTLNSKDGVALWFNGTSWLVQ